MLTTFLYITGGFIGLYIGAEWLVRGSASLARSTGIRPVVIALTIVAFGTSAPEFVVTVNASIQGTAGIAIGNIIGSIIANTGLILGIAALVKPLDIGFRLIKKEFPILIVCELIFFAMSWNLRISRLEGAMLFIGFIVFSWFYIREASSNIRGEKERVKKQYDKYINRRGAKTSYNIIAIIVGLGALILGSHLAIKGSVGLAKIFGISEFIIAASLVALGTSLPELATSVVAAARGECDISIGNVIGSNIFNLLMCIGAASIVRPITIEPGIIRIDLPVTIGMTLLLGLFMWAKKSLGRLEGIILLLIYGAYILHLFH